MPHFDIVKVTAPSKSFENEFLRNKFDIADEKIQEHFSGDFDLPETWGVGVIVGPSGSGKTTIAREIFGKFFQKEWASDLTVFEQIKGKSLGDIAEILTKVGFSSPPSWLKPYHCLSNGQKMRVDLAAAISESEDMIVFDEFTSVVDRQTAKTGSFAIAKFIRKTNKKFIAVTCHYDVLDWLEPDWVFDTESMRFYQGVTSPSTKDRQWSLRLDNAVSNFGPVLRSITI